MENPTSQRATDGEVTCEQCRYFVLKVDGSYVKRRCTLYRIAPTVVCVDFRKGKNARKENLFHSPREGGGQRQTSLREEDGSGIDTSKDKKL